MGNPTLTVVMARPGIEADGGLSVAGHMYYVLTGDDGKPYSYGLCPLVEHSLWGPGQVTNEKFSKTDR